MMPLNSVFASDDYIKIETTVDELLNGLDMTSSQIRNLPFIDSGTSYTPTISIQYVVFGGRNQPSRFRNFSSTGKTQIELTHNDVLTLSDVNSSDKITFEYSGSEDLQILAGRTQGGVSYKKIIVNYDDFDSFFQKPPLVPEMITDIPTTIKRTLAGGGLLSAALIILGVWLTVGLVKRSIFWFLR